MKTVKQYLPAVLIVATAVAAYANSFSGAFVWDDLDQIGENPSIRTIWPPWVAAFGTISQPARPIPQYTFALNHALFGPDVWGYHLVNLAIHASNALVLFGIVRRTLLSPRLAERFGRHAETLALIIALIWVAHPLQTQAVTYIWQRIESLMSLFFLLTLYGFIRGVDSPARSRWWFGVSVACCALGMGCKEVTVVAPLVVLWYDGTFWAPSWSKLFHQRRAYYLALSATYVVMAALFVHEQWNYLEHQVPSHTPMEHLVTQAGIIVRYLRLAVWPHPGDLNFGYAWPVAKTLGEIVPPGLVIVSLLGLTVTAIFRWPTWSFLGGWFFLILAPTSSVVVVYDRATEHRMYLPLAAVIVLAVMGAYLLWSAAAERWQWSPTTRRLSAVVPTAALVALLAWGSHVRNRVYHDPLLLWADVLAKNPVNPQGLGNYPSYLIRAGRYEEAYTWAQRALQQDVTHYTTYTNLGLSLIKLGRPAEAHQYLEHALELMPNSGQAHYNLALSIADSNPLAAYQHLQTALQLAPEDVGAHVNMANFLVRRNKLDAAIQHYRQALVLDPKCELARENLQIALEMQQEAAAKPAQSAATP